MADAIALRNRHENRVTSAAAVASGEVYQLDDGRAGVYTGLNSAASGDVVGFCTSGVFSVSKTASMVMVKGQSVWWDHSANAATITPSKTDRDFFLGTVHDDAASAATTVEVNLNVKPAWTVDLTNDPFDSVVVLTAGTPQLRDLGGAKSMEFSATAEAQKVDMLSKQGFGLESNWVVEGAFEVVDDGDAAAIDFNIGVASGTHASDADTIAESVFIHTDGNAVNISAESDDGTNEQAAADTTVDYALGSRVHFCIDGRDTSSVKLYINGVRVLSGKTFNVSDGSGPLYLLAHLEKSSDNTTAEYHVDWLRCVTSEVG